MKAPVLFGLFGAGGFGREVMPIAREVLKTRFADRDVQIVFVDSNSSSAAVNGVPCWTPEKFFAENQSEKYFNVAIANSRIRQKVAEEAKMKKIQSLSLISPRAEIGDGVQIGEGAIVFPLAVLTANIQIGMFFHCYFFCSVAHDARIGDFVTFAPGVHCNGNIKIEDHAYLGSGCLLKHGQPGKPLTIGREAIVGMGAVVTKDVGAKITVVGNPAKTIMNESKV